MSVLPDPDELDAIAGRIADHARAVRGRARFLAGSLAPIEWHGFAADLARARAEALVHGLQRSAGRLDDAADALRRHSARVRQAEHELAGLSHSVVAALDVVSPVAAGIHDVVQLCGG